MDCGPWLPGYLFFMAPLAPGRDLARSQSSRSICDGPHPTLRVSDSLKILEILVLGYGLWWG